MVQIVINSPYACYNEIEIDSTGIGTAVLGFRNSNQDKSIKKQKDFFINSESDRIEISDLIKLIELRAPITSPHGNDLYNFTLTVNNRKLIDKYGQDSLLDNVLKTLLPYVQIEGNGQCDYFNLLRQALSNSSKKIEK